MRRSTTESPLELRLVHEILHLSLQISRQTTILDPNSGLSDDDQWLRRRAEQVEVSFEKSKFCILEKAPLPI